MSPVGRKPRARQQFSAGKTRICSSRTVAGQFQLKLDMQPFGLKPKAKTVVQCRKSDSSPQQSSSRAVSNQIGHAPVRLEAQGQTAVQCRPSDSSQQQNNSSQNTAFQTEPCEIGESTQGFLSGRIRGGGLYGLPGAEKTAPWHKEKATLGKTDL